MSDNPQTPESGLEAQEPQGIPTPNVSQPSGDQQPSGSEVGSADALEEIQSLRKQVEAIPEIVQRAVQSQKDRNLDRANIAFQGVSAETLRLYNSYLKRFDGDEDRAIREMELDTMLAERRQSDAPVHGRTGSQVAERDTNLDDEIALRLGKARLNGVEVSNAELQEVWGEGPWPTNQAALDALDAHIEKKKRQLNVTPAAAVGSGGRPPGATSQESELRAQYDKEMSQIRSGKHPTIKRGQAGAIVALQREYRKKGLDI